MLIDKMVENMPDDIIDFEIIDDKLRGFTEAKLIEIDNIKYVLKLGMSNGQIRDEYTSNQIYRIIGVNTPDMALYKLDERYAILSKWVENKIGLDFISEEPLKRQEFILEKVSNSFVADAFLSNWDIYMLDNIIFDSNNNIYRVDSGGALRFRARGKDKGKAFENEVNEITSMFKTAPKSISKFLNDDIIRKQMIPLVSKKEEILELVKFDLELYDKLKNRINDLENRLFMI